MFGGSCFGFGGFVFKRGVDDGNYAEVRFTVQGHKFVSFVKGIEDVFDWHVGRVMLGFDALGIGALGRFLSR